MSTSRFAFSKLGIAYALGFLLLTGVFGWMAWTVRLSLPQTAPPAPFTASTPSFDKEQAQAEADRCAGLTEGDRRDDCWFGLALASLDVGVCNRIESEQWRDTCLFQIAVTTLNRSVCGQVRNVDDRKLCEERVPEATQ